MYIRFITPHRDRCARTHTGLFRAGLPDEPARDDWRRAEVLRLYRWFNDELDVPDRVTYRPGRKAERGGVCWFRPEARRFINNARYLGWLLSDLGLPVQEIRADNPGEVLWSDADQVVALPRRLN